MPVPEYINKINVRLTKNVIWNLANEIISKASIVLANVFLARRLGPESYGILILSQAVAMYVRLAVDLGTTMYGIREIGKSKENSQKLINQLITIRFVLGVVIYAFYTYIIIFIIGSSNTIKLTYLCSGLYLLAYSFNTDWIFKGLEKFRILSYGGAANAIFQVVGIIVFVKKAQDIIIAALIFSLSYFFSSSIFIYILRKIGLSFRLSLHWPDLKIHVRESIEFMIPGLISAGYQYLPIFLAGKLMTQQVAGLFLAPFRFVTSMTAPGFYISMAFYPVLSDTYHNNKILFHKVLQKLHAVMFCIGVTLGLIGFLFGGRINMLLFGKQYAGSADVFSILALILTVNFLRNGYVSALRAAGYQLSLIIPYIFASALLSGLYFFLYQIDMLDSILYATVIVLTESLMLAIFMITAKMTYDNVASGLDQAL